MNDTHNDTLSLSRRCFSNSQPALLLLVPALSCLPYLLQPERTQMKHVASKPYLFPLYLKMQLPVPTNRHS